MAVLTITANLKTKGRPSQETVTADMDGITPGLFVYRVTNSNTGTIGRGRLLLNTSAEASQCYGIAVTEADEGEPFTVWRYPGFVLDANTFPSGALTVYAASGTAGQLEPVADASTGDYGSIVGASYDQVNFIFIRQFIARIAA